MNIPYIVVTPEVSHAPMSSLKDAAAVLQLLFPPDNPQNKCDMSVTPPTSHLEMWPYVALAAVGFESHASTAVLMLPSCSAMAAAAGNPLATHRSAAGPIIVAQGSLNHAHKETIWRCS